ncbi:TfoX/Sxy family protein [Nannocystaceae bacterium ST9]
MSFDEALARRIRDLLAHRDDVDEKRMFGGIAFLLTGRMFCGLATDDLMVRVGPAFHEAALARPHARPMDFTGRPMVGYVYVAPAGLKGEGLREWVEAGLSFVETLPEKKKAAAKKKVATKKKVAAKKKAAARPR